RALRRGSVARRGLGGCARTFDSTPRVLHRPLASPSGRRGGLDAGRRRCVPTLASEPPFRVDPRISAGRRSDLSGSYREPYPRPMGALTEFHRGGKKRPPKGNLSRGAGDLNIREGWVNRLRFSRLALGCLLAMSCRLVGTL